MLKDHARFARAGCLAAAVAALASVSQAQTRVPAVRCAPAAKYACMMGGRCASAAEIGTPIVEWSRIIPSTQTYERCDQEGCRPQPFEAYQSGEYTIVDLVGTVGFVKIAPDQAYVEVVSLNTSVIITYGYCRAE